MVKLIRSRFKTKITMGKKVGTGGSGRGPGEEARGKGKGEGREGKGKSISEGSRDGEKIKGRWAIKGEGGREEG